MSQCPQCGAHVGGERPFCGACGASLAPAAGNENVTQVRPPAGQPDAQPPAQQQWTPQPPPPAPQGAPQAPPGYGAPQGQQFAQQPQGGPAYGAPQGQQFAPPPHAAPQFDFSKLLVGNW